VKIISIAGCFGLAVISLFGIPASLLWLNLERLWPRKSRCARSVKPVHVAYVLTDISGGKPGGAASHKTGFCKGLQAAGHRSTVLVCEAVPGLDHIAQDYRVLSPPEVPTGVPLTVSVLANNIAFVRKARTILKDSPPDVICHRHSQMNYSGAWLSRVFRVPFILEYNSPANWTKSATGGKEALLSIIRRMIEAINLRAADRVMVVSGVLKDQLTERGVAPNKIVVNPNGADAEMFSPEIDGWMIRERLGLDGKIVVGFAGHHNSNNTWHGTRHLALAVENVIERRKDVQFLFIGDQGVVDLVSPIIEAGGTMDFVTFATNVPYSDMPIHYAACDILVSPHVHMADGNTFFGSPVKIFEYMAMGKAIVASGIGQLAELLEDRVNALLTRPGDSEGIADAILTLVGDAALRQRLGTAARGICLGHCTWKHNAERFVQAYCDAQEQGRDGMQSTGVDERAARLRGIVENEK